MAGGLRKMSGGTAGCTGHECVAEAVPGAVRLPSPAGAVAICPGSGVEGRPSPGIRGDPGVTGAGIPGPGAIVEWAPGGTGEIRSPHGAACSGGGEVSVIEHIAGAVAVGGG